MRCPKCGIPMMLDDQDEDYGRIKWQAFVVRRKTWWVCCNCNCGAQKEEKYSYFDEDGTEIKIEEDVI